MSFSSIFFTVVPTQAAFDFSAGRRTTRHGVLRASGESVTSHGMCVVLICRNIHFFNVVPTQAAFDFSAAGRRTTRHGVLRASGESVRFLRRTAYNKARRAAGSQRRHQQVCRTHQRSFSGVSAAPAAGNLQPHSGRNDRCGNILLASSASAAAARTVACFRRRWQRSGASHGRRLLPTRISGSIRYVFLFSSAVVQQQS